MNPVFTITYAADTNTQNIPSEG